MPHKHKVTIWKVISSLLEKKKDDIITTNEVIKANLFKKLFNFFMNEILFLNRLICFEYVISNNIFINTTTPIIDLAK